MPPPSRSLFLSGPFSLRLPPLSVGLSLLGFGQCQNSGAVRRDGNPSWSEFPTPIRPCARIPHTCARAARAGARVSMCTYIRAYNRVHPRAHAHAPRRADLCVDAARMHRQLCASGGRAFRCLLTTVMAKTLARGILRILTFRRE